MKRKFFWHVAAEITIVFDAVFEEEFEPAGGDGRRCVIFEREMGLRLGLIGFVLPRSAGGKNFHNAFRCKGLGAFWLWANWVCFAKKEADL